MEFAINNSPELTMTDITKKLFNNKYLSDIQFNVNGEIIYAHSFELMKRSLVFQCQLETTIGERKLIPIAEVKYRSFFQFMRFVYTDECEITTTNAFELLKLAVAYKVIRLENQLVDFLFCNDLAIQLGMLQFCVVENYQLPFNRIADIIAYKYKTVINSPLFITIEPEALREILKFNRIENGVEEIDLFERLVQWINHYCSKKDIKLAERRYYFQEFIRLIRFPIMTDPQIMNCFRKCSDLFTDSDCATFYRQMANGCNIPNILWNKQHRLPVHNPLEEKIFQCLRNGQVLFETKFIVTQEMILTGLRFGNDTDIFNYKIKISESNTKTDKVNVLRVNVQLKVNWGSTIVSLGESLKMKPNKHYTIGIYHLANHKKVVKVICRCANDKLLVNDSTNSVKILETDDNMIEIFFKPINNIKF